MHTYILNNRWALGDTVCLSALVRDIHRAYPGEFNLLMSGNYLSMWENNPYCAVHKGEQGQTLALEYLESIKAAGRGDKIHFLSAFHKDFEKLTGLPVPVTAPRGEIYLSAKERQPLYPFRYWVVVAGGKKDMTTKIWSAVRWQAVVDQLAQRGIQCVQAGADFVQHFHPRLQRVAQAIGKTDSIRDLFRLIARSEGVICGITGAMHIAACFDKPCVVVAGGREEPWWEAYSNCYYPTAFGPACSPVEVEHTYLHTVGLLDCGCGNMTKGCWRMRTVPLEQADYTNAKNKRELCTRPVKEGVQPLPECLALITADHVVEAVMNYYEKGFLPPITPAEHRERAKKEPVALVKGPYEEQTEFTSSLQAVEDEHGRLVIVDKDGKPLPKHVPEPQTLLELSVFEQVGVGRGPVGLEPMFQAIEKHLGQFRSREGEDPELSVLDHPYIGGKFTVCVLCYGDHLELAQRCLGSIVHHAPVPGRIDLRVALNQPSKRVLDYVMGFPKGMLRKVSVNAGERRKYQAMRTLFWDDQPPIETNYVLWFDDDSHVVDPKWLVLLGKEIIANHPQQCRLYGAKYLHDLMPYRKKGHKPEKWFQEAPWWQNQWLHLAGGQRVATNGHVIAFVSGGFWAIATEAIRKGDIPDRRLDHHGGDIVIGEQVHQAGFKIKNFGSNKKPVAWSDAPPRGASKTGAEKKLPWDAEQ